MKLLITVNLGGRSEYNGTLSRRASIELVNNRSIDLPRPLYDAIYGFAQAISGDFDTVDFTRLCAMAGDCGQAIVATPDGRARVEVHRFNESERED